MTDHSLGEEGFPNAHLNNPDAAGQQIEHPEQDEQDEDMTVILSARKAPQTLTSTTSLQLNSIPRRINPTCKDSTMSMKRTKDSKTSGDNLLVLQSFTSTGPPTRIVPLSSFGLHRTLLSTALQRTWLWCLQRLTIPLPLMSTIMSTA